MVRLFGGRAEVVSTESVKTGPKSVERIGSADIRFLAPNDLRGNRRRLRRMVRAIDGKSPSNVQKHANMYEIWWLINHGFMDYHVDSNGITTLHYTGKKMR